MVARTRFIFLLALMFSGGATTFAKEWRGLVPLRSTRSDVSRILHHCSDSHDACTFAIDNEDAYIFFASGLKQESNECAESLSPDLVVFIEVRPRGPLTFDALRLDKRQLESFNVPASFERRLKAYRTKDGLVVSTLNGRVLQLDYIADPNSERGCRDYYDDVEAFVQTLREHPPPSVLIDCRRELTPGETFSLWGAFMATRRGFTWTVKGGKIVSGQGAHRISVTTTGEPGQKLKLSVEFQDSFRMTAETTCEIPIVSKRP